MFYLCPHPPRGWRQPQHLHIPRGNAFDNHHFYHNSYLGIFGKKTQTDMPRGPKGGGCKSPIASRPSPAHWAVRGRLPPPTRARALSIYSSRDRCMAPFGTDPTLRCSPNRTRPPKTTARTASRRLFTTAFSLTWQLLSSWASRLFSVRSSTSDPCMSRQTPPEPAFSSRRPRVPAPSCPVNGWRADPATTIKLLACVPPLALACNCNGVAVSLPARCRP